MLYDFFIANLRLNFIIHKNFNTVAREVALYTYSVEVICPIRTTIASRHYRIARVNSAIPFLPSVDKR